MSEKAAPPTKSSTGWKTNTASKPENNRHGALLDFTACRAGYGGNRRFIAQDNPHRAFTFIAELRNQYTRVAASPKVFRLRTELGNDIRSCAYGSYVIFFQESPVELCIVRVLHGAMDIENRFSEK